MGDIRRRADALAENGSGGTHFLGSVVLAPGVMLPSMHRWIVVDGQQRRLTFGRSAETSCVLMWRLNRARGVDIPQVKLALYPSFRVDVLADPRAYSAVLDALRWFVAQLDA